MDNLLLPIFGIGFQERMVCANVIEKTTSFSYSGEGRIRLEFLWI